MNGISYISHNVLALLTLKLPAKSASKNVVCLSSLLLHIFANIIDLCESRLDVWTTKADGGKGLTSICTI